MKLRDITESGFQYYDVKHKPSGKVYKKIVALHSMSALEKAKRQHGGTASRYTGTSISDFEIVEAVNEIAPIVPIVGGVLARQGIKQGAKQFAKNMTKGAGGQVARKMSGDSNKAVYTVHRGGKEIYNNTSFTNIDRRLWKLITGKLPIGKIDPEDIILKRDGVQVPHKYKGNESQPITGPIAEGYGSNTYGLKAIKVKQNGRWVYISMRNNKETGRFDTEQELRKHQQEIINRTSGLLDSKINSGTELEEGAVGNVAATLAIAASLYGLNSMAPSAKDTPLGKELSIAAQQGDQVAAYHLNNLDLYVDSSMSRTLTNLKIAYIEDSPRKDVKIFLSDPKRFPQLKIQNESIGEFITEEEFDRLAEKKDACYHKVKSRYKVWPSAYASGALVQCRKKGAKNWGNSKK